MLPGIISERIFSVFDQDEDKYLSLIEFVVGMIALFTESYENLVKIVFNIYDYDRDGLISRSDIRLIFSYIPLRTKAFASIVKFKYEHNDTKHRIDSQQEIIKYLDKIFGAQDLIDQKFFSKSIEEVSSEVFLYVSNLVILQCS